MTNLEKIKQEILNENYITAIKALLLEYQETKDVDFLENIHIILSKSLISNRFDVELLNDCNKLFIEKGFNEIKCDFVKKSIGIAEFPVVGEDNAISSIKAIVVTDGKEDSRENNKLDNKIDGKKELLQVINHLQLEIQKNIRDEINRKIQDITILNWGLSFTFREHLLKDTKLEPNTYLYSVKGASLHFATAVGCVSKIFELPIDPDFIFTGAFDEAGNSLRIESLQQKVNLIVKERPKIKKIFVPNRSMFTTEEQNLISKDSRFVEVANLVDLIYKVFNKQLINLCELSLEERKTIGYAMIWAEYLGEKNLVFSKDYEILTQKKKCIVIHFIRPGIDYKAYKIFPIEKVMQEFDSEADFIIFEGALANHYTGYLMTCNEYKQRNAIFGVRLGYREPTVVVFAAPRGSNLVGYQCDFF